MGPAFSINVNNISQDFQNNLTQITQQSCIVNSNVSITGNVVVLNGSKFNGDVVGFRAGSSADATCSMTSTMDANVTNMLKTITEQNNASTTSLLGDLHFGSLSYNENDISQSSTNNITQINQILCSANNIQSTTNNYVYVTDVQGGANFIGFDSTSNASASCAINTNSKIAVYNQAQADATQKNTKTTTFGLFLAIIAGFIGIAIFFTILMFAKGSISKVGYDKNAATPQSEQDKELAALKELGITPDQLTALTDQSTQLTQLTQLTPPLGTI